MAVLDKRAMKLWGVLFVTGSSAGAAGGFSRRLGVGLPWSIVIASVVGIGALVILAVLDNWYISRRR